MARCEDCIHGEACAVFCHIRKALLGDMADKACELFKPTADVAPKTETAREIFAEIEDLFFDKYLLGNITASLFEDKYAELKDKYCGKDTNVPAESEVET